MPAQIHNTSHESSRMACAGVETGSKICERCTGLSMLPALMLEVAGSVRLVCNQGVRRQYNILSQLSNILTAMPSEPTVQSTPVLPGSYDLTSVSNASKLLRLQGV